MTRNQALGNTVATELSLTTNTLGLPSSIVDCLIRFISFLPSIKGQNYDMSPFDPTLYYDLHVSSSFDPTTLFLRSNNTLPYTA